MILQQGSQVCAQVSDGFQTHSMLMISLRVECASLTRKRTTEISCMVGVKAHVQKRLDTGLNEGPCVLCLI